MTTTVICDLETYSNDELIRLLLESFARTVKEIAFMASALRQLEQRGVDTTKLKCGLKHYLRLVGNGQVLPGVLLKCSDNRALLDLLVTLPIPDQQRILDGTPVQLWHFLPDGTPDHRLVDPDILTRRQLNQVFARGHIRNQGEQLMLLQDQATQAKKPLPEKVGKLLIDPEAAGAWVGRQFIPLDDLVRAVNQLKRVKK